MGLFHELCNDAVEGFFGVDSITMSRIVRIEQVGKEVDGGDGGIDTLSVLIHAIDALKYCSKEPSKSLVEGVDYRCIRFLP